jgi:hypothetical protein
MFLLKQRRPEKYGDQPRAVVGPPQHTTFNGSSVKFDKLSEGLDLIERLRDGLIQAQEPKLIAGVKA